MSEQPQENTDADAISTPEKGTGSKKLIIIILAVLLLGGGGGAGYYFLSGSAAKDGADTAEKDGSAQDDTEEDKSDEETDEDTSTSGKSLKSVLPKDEEVKSIIELQPFIVNLADTEQARYLRMSVSLGVGEGGEKDKPDQLYITRVRNAMLTILSDKPSEEILSMEGKANLRKDLLRAAQTVADEPKIYAIYITDFIVQL